jgi:hypothetical protein
MKHKALGSTRRYLVSESLVLFSFISACYKFLLLSRPAFLQEFVAEGTLRGVCRTLSGLTATLMF